MKRLADLREERARLLDECTSMNAKYPGTMAMPKEDTDRLNHLLGKVDEIDADMSGMHAHADSLIGGAGQRLDAWNVGDTVVKTLRTAAEIRAHYRPRAGSSVGARSDMTLRDFVRGVAGLSTTESVRAALTEGTDSAGGFLIPSLVMPQVLEALMPASAVLSAGASILPLSMGAKSYTTSAIDVIPTAAWRAENGALAESEPAFRAVVATPRSLSFYFKVSRELVADGANLQRALVTAMAQSFARELDRVALRGSGTAPEPRGILNTINVNAVANGGAGAALASYANLFSAMQEILQDDGPTPTAAIMSPRSLVKLGGLVDSTGQPVARPTMLDSMKLLGTSQVPNNLTVGASTDCSEIFVGDFTQIVFAMREQMSIQKIDQLFATTGQLGFICHARADVLTLYPKAFAVVTGVRP